MDSEVVATTDGRHYRPVVALRVPVRYPALAVLGSRIYVFGGLGANGRPSDAVQLVDPAGRTARVVGRLPRPLEGAAAGSLGGTIYLAGGRTAAGPTKAVYAFQPRGASFLRAGSLRVGVAYAGAAVSNGRLWIVGGESRRPAADRRRPDGRPEPGLRQSRRSGRRVAVRRRQAADRRPGQRPAAPPRRPRQSRLEIPVARAGGATRRLLLPRRRLLHPPRDRDRLQPGGQPHDRRDRLSVGAHRLPVRAPAQSGNCRRVPQHPRRHIRARQRPDERRRRRELPRPHHRPAHEARRPPDRHAGPLRARPAGRARLAERRHAPRERQPARLGDQRQLDRRAHALGTEGLGRAPRDRLPLGSAAARARTATSSPTTSTREGSSSSTGAAGSCTATSPRAASACSITRPSSSGFLPASSWSTTTTTTGWSRSTRRPGLSSGSTG